MQWCTHSAYDHIMSTIKNFPTIIPARFGSNWHNSFKGKHVLYIGQSETKMPYISHAFCLIIMKREILEKDLLNIIPVKFSCDGQVLSPSSIWQFIISLINLNVC